MWFYGITQSQHCNSDNNCNDDSVMRASMWFKFFGGLFECQSPCYIGGKHDNKEWGLNQEYPFPRVLKCERRSDIKEVDNMEFRV